MAGARLGELALVGLVGLVLAGVAAAGTRARPADPPPPAEDGMPSGAVAYFPDGGCPPGWEVATEVQGRLVVAVSDDGAAGVLVGIPLGDREDRTHQHPFGGTLTLGDKGLASFDGSNRDGASAGAIDIKGTTDPATSGLPFFQMQACVKP